MPAIFGHYFNIFGIEGYVDIKRIINDEIKLMFNSSDKWTMPINFNDIDNIDRLVKLQAFY